MVQSRERQTWQGEQRNPGKIDRVREGQLGSNHHWDQISPVSCHSKLYTQPNIFFSKENDMNITPILLQFYIQTCISTSAKMLHQSCFPFHARVSDKRFEPVSKYSSDGSALSVLSHRRQDGVKQRQKPRVVSPSWYPTSTKPDQTNAPQESYSRR